MERSRAAGWTPIDPLHLELLRYEHGRREIGDAAMEGPSGPVVEWPEEWGRWSLVDHRRAIAEHWRESERIAMEEARSRRW